MRLVVNENVTADGTVEMLDDWFDPSEQNADMVAEMNRQDETCDAMLFGRQTFEDFRGYWPLQTDDTTGFTDQLNQVQKYVVSSTMTDPQWQNSTVLSGDPVEEIRRLKQQPGRDLVLAGSIELLHLVIEQGLVDEYRLFIFPAVQGRGRRLFPDGFTGNLTVIDQQRFGDILYAAYQPAG